ncbi:MAG: helix-turn-helix domain containing protein [Clostridiales bacterium]|nr:helix-turn-helix domain containing protein [Clostridiales bacterium]
MTIKQARGLSALLSSNSIPEAAKEAGISEGTLRRWLREDDEFSAAYNEGLRTMLADAVHVGRVRSAEAMGVFDEVMGDTTINAQTRITAARSLLEFTLRLAASTDLQKQMDELERRVENLDGGGEF